MLMDADLFRDNINEDIHLYLQVCKKRPGCVLMFPPVDNYKRFLIHNSVENFDNLCSFSIGHGAERRTVISDKDNLTRTADLSSSITRNPCESSPEATPIRDRTKVNRRPDRPVYVQPRSRVIAQPTGSKEKSEILKRMSQPSDKSKTSSKTSKEMTPATTLNTRKDEDADDGDWDSMFADDGECLNPDMMKELTSAIKNVSIVPAPKVTSVVHEQETELLEDEFAHVIEVSHFPVEFKTQDLMMLFMQYKESGFTIQWVDDTHALVIFSSAKIANEVVETKYAGVRLKRLSEASAESKGRAKRCGATMKPFKARPETSAILARRLVAGALGIKSKASKETIENERRILREAKEKKLLARKEQKDLWEDDAA